MAKKVKQATPIAYSLIEEPKGFISKREITNADPRFLIKGSKNVIINDGDKVASRLGYVVDGQSNTVKKGIDSSWDFQSKQGLRVLRANQGATANTGVLQVRTEYTSGTPLYYDLMNKLQYTDFSFASWWYDTEVTRALIFVDGTTSIRMWGGGVAYVAKNTSSTITKTGALMTASTITFVSSLKQIKDSANGFIEAGFQVGDKILISGSTGNSKDYVIESITAGSIIVKSQYTIIDELAGPSITIKKEGTKTWAEEGFFISHSGRTIKIPGQDDLFTYTGGETTLTLTGLTAVPALTVGTPIFQGVVTVTSVTGVSVPVTPTSVDVRDNQILYGDRLSSVVWVSKNTDYKDASFTTPLRKPGEGAKIVLDDYFRGFVQDEEDIFIHAGRNDVYKVVITLSADGTTENIKVKKLKLGAGQAALSQKAIIPVKNGTMYFTNEKTLTWATSVQNINTPQALPISDPIKDDFDSFDLTGVNGKFYGNAIWIAIPRENLVYIYDFDKSLWQPPQTLPVASFSIIDNVLYGHSNNSNETYKLNTGFDDNGVIIEFVARFAYRSYGDRAVYKQFDQYFSELYMSLPTVVKVTHWFEYDGSDGEIINYIDSKESKFRFATSLDGGLGKANLGKNPLGSVLTKTTSAKSFGKYRKIDTLKTQDFFEHLVTYSSDTENAQFELIAHGPNVTFSTNLPISITE